MTVVRKFSLSYDGAEDRIAWDAEDVAGGATRVWLTQRFCREFVAALLPRLPKPAAGDVAPEHEATVQGWEQAAAMTHFGKTPGVKVTPESTAGLVRAGHISPKRTGMTLAFDFGADQQRSIDLDVAATRQMLRVMYDLHVAAGWPTDVWPTWITGPGATETASALN
jgi:hypothetical protein